MEVQINSYTTQAREMREHNLRLQNQFSKVEVKSIKKENELFSLIKKLEDNDNNSSSKISNLPSQINNLLTEIDILRAQKEKLEEQIIFESD